ncbi:MAG: ABC transporter ATP-binding protein [Muribaculaceae bacterium]|nr:ABC transporter ATP-binding protein [Muribaculaceae bacterium]
MIQARDITKRFGSLQVLRGVNVRIGEGEVVSIVGPSGAGKTTLLQILGTLDTPDAGSVLIGGEDVVKLRGKELARFRNRNVGFVFQFHQLLPEFTTLENVMIPALIGGTKKADAEKHAVELLEYMGLTDRLNHKPAQLSGGERQRVAVARALINKPKVVLADEPSGSLDSRNKRELHELFFRLRKELKQTFVIVTHDESLAAECDRVLHMRDGIIVGEGADAPEGHVIMENGENLR